MKKILTLCFDANCQMAFFDVGEACQIELIQPNGVKSTWQDFLDEHGEGIHHLAFKVKKTDAQTYTDMYDYLRGRVAGVTVTSDKRIFIRGIGTNSDATDPLILVDGVETTDLTGINPADVQSVDVIKDGSSAIYGMRGSNGVVIINTVGSHGN